MTVAAQGGLFGFGKQSAKIGAGGTYNPASIKFYKVLAPRIAMGAQQSVQPMPLEVGGAITPTGMYKDQAFFSGSVDILPRMKTAGLILLGAAGKIATTADTAFGTANTGVHTHKFTFDPVAPADQPWMAFRRMTPGATTNMGETGFDCKIPALRITIPQRGKIAFRVGVTGRDFVLDDASAWTWENATYEDSTLIPESGSGHFKIGGAEYPIVGMQIDIINGLTQPNDEMIVGSYNPDDFIAQRRSVTLRATYKYEDPGLYNQLLTGSTAGTTWSNLPFSTGSGSNDAIEAYFEATADIPGAATAQKYAIKVTAEKVTWQVDGPPMLQGGGIVMLNLIGTIVQPASGDYITIEIVNEDDGTMYA